MITFGSLFAGIGGFDLGFERAGMTCKWQVEIDDYANRVLEKHWPDVRRHGDIKTFPPGDPDDWRVDCICGGFPCQDISYAGRGAGLDGERSGLFFDAMRVVRELEPRVVVLENVAALLTRGMDDVLGTLASIGFDAEWHCVPAAAVGAPHIRDRVFIIGHRTGILGDTERTSENALASRCGSRDTTGESSSDVSNSIRAECEPRARGRRIRKGDSEQREVSDTKGQRFGAGRSGGIAGAGSGKEDAADLAVANDERLQGQREVSSGTGEEFGDISNESWGAIEPAVCRISNGLSERLDGGGLDVNERWLQVSRSEITGRLLRSVWNNGQLECSPQGREFGEQFAREYPDLVRQLPHETSLGGRQETVEEIRRCLCRLRQGVDSWDVRNASDTIEAAWQSAPQETKDWLRMGACGRTNWAAGEWPSVPRVATGIPKRVDRLRGLGNAVVPQVAEWIGRRVVELLA